MLKTYLSAAYENNRLPGYPPTELEVFSPKSNRTGLFLLMGRVINPEKHEIRYKAQIKVSDLTYSPAISIPFLFALPEIS